MIRTALSVGIAGGAIAAALIDTLTAKGILTADDARDLGHRAQTLLTPYMGTSQDAVEAARIVSEMLIGPPKAGM